ncbi:MAG: hypothetical protein ABII26_00540 [Pseudomonadota bacterium]
MKGQKLTQSYFYAPGEIPPGVTLGEYLERTVQRFPEKKAFVFKEKKVKWGDLGQVVDRLAF